MAKTPKDWLRKYYPVPAKRMKRASKIAAIEHSLRKWLGLRVIKKYGIRKIDNALIDNTTRQAILDVNFSTCSLCVKYFDVICSKCPLAQVRNGIPCDKPMVSGTKIANPYASFIIKDNPEPMIFWLRKALRMAKKEQSKRLKSTKTKNRKEG